jgi:hypothetical protein
MKVFYTKRFPPKGFAAINLFGVVIGRSEHGNLSIYELNHERIHSRQIIELLWVFFYLFYVTEWLVRLIRYRNSRLAYYNISFEREAYSNDRNLDYLKERKLFSSFKYLFRRHENR